MGNLIPCGSPTEPCTACHLVELANNVFSFLVKISLGLAVLCTVVAGILYLTSSGSPKLVQSAKIALKYTLIGFALTLTAWVVINVMAQTLGYKGPNASWWDLSDFQCTWKTITPLGIRGGTTLTSTYLSSSPAFIVIDPNNPDSFNQELKFTLHNADGSTEQVMPQIYSTLPNLDISQDDGTFKLDYNESSKQSLLFPQAHAATVINSSSFNFIIAILKAFGIIGTDIVTPIPFTVLGSNQAETPTETQPPTIYPQNPQVPIKEWPAITASPGCDGAAALAKQYEKESPSRFCYTYGGCGNSCEECITESKCAAEYDCRDRCDRPEATCYDCKTFVDHVWQKAGLRSPLPEIQHNGDPSATDCASLKNGDILIKSSGESGSGRHMGIYADGLVIHNSDSKNNNGERANPIKPARASDWCSSLIGVVKC